MAITATAKLRRRPKRKEEAMRRTFFCTLVSVAAFAFVPASSLAREHQREHHHARHHLKRTHHARVHHKRFGTIGTGSSGSTGSGSTGSGGGMPSSDTAGTIASFDGTKLTLTLNDGSTVSGTVNGDTEIECMSATSTQDSFQRNDHGGDNGGGDDQGANHDQGDDNGNDQGDNDGDDNGQNCTMADLKPGSTVTGAELKISSAGAVWDKVELLLS
jgi:hypothetical protein